MDLDRILNAINWKRRSGRVLLLQAALTICAIAYMIYGAVSLN